MYKTNEKYIEEILADLEFIIAHMTGVTKEVLEADPVLTDSMSFRLIQISEKSKCLSEDFKELHDDVPWYEMNALRNRLVHDYGSVDLSIVFDTLTKDIPSLRDELKTLLK